MKNLLLLLALTSFIFYSCEKDEVETDKEKEETTNGETDENGDSLTVKDYDGNVYKTIIIGNQEWMAENLKATHYADGTPILHVTGDATWGALPDNDADTASAYCWYNDSIEYKDQYGALYTYAAATNGDNSGSDVQGVCPTGWRLPSDADWDTLVDAVGGSSVAGDILKATSGWNDDGNGTDDIGFAALPGGYRSRFNGSFSHAGTEGLWWCSTEDNASYAWNRNMSYLNAKVLRIDLNKSLGFSVRCVRDVD